MTLGYMRLLWCAALLGMGVFTGAAQTRKAPPPGTLHSIAVTGNQRYSTGQIVKASGLHTGQHVTPEDIEAARQHLQDLQIFSKVADRYRFTYNPINYDLTFEVSEIEQVFPIRFERLKVSAEDLRDYLKSNLAFYSDQIPATDAVLARYRNAIQQFVAQHGQPAKIKSAVSSEDPQHLAVVFAPDAPVPNISQVEVSGNDKVDTGTILRAVNGVAIGMPMTDETVKRILDGTLKPLFATYGLVAVSFPTIETEPAKHDQGVVLKIGIKEGPVFRFGAIRFRGTGIEEDEIRAALPFKPGQSFNARQVDDLRIDLQHRLRRRGYLDASVLDDINPDNSKRVVNVVYTLTPGSAYTFAKLEIRGLDISTEPEIEQLWGEKPGKPFNPDYPDYFLKRVDEEKLLDHVAESTSDYVADPASHNVTVRLFFRGGKTKSDVAREKKEEEEREKPTGDWSPW